MSTYEPKEEDLTSSPSSSSPFQGSNLLDSSFLRYFPHFCRRKKYKSSTRSNNIFLCFWCFPFSACAGGVEIHAACELAPVGCAVERRCWWWWWWRVPTSAALPHPPRTSLQYYWVRKCLSLRLCLAGILKSVATFLLKKNNSNINLPAGSDKLCKTFARVCGKNKVLPGF